MKLSQNLKESMQNVLKAGNTRCDMKIVCVFCDYEPYCKTVRETYKLARKYLEDNTND